MNIQWVVCGVLRAEIESLISAGELPGDMLFLDSMLHMCPVSLEKELVRILDKVKDRPIVIVYGDCCPGMVDLTRNTDIVRVKATNCAQMLLDREEYRRLMRSEAFIMLPEWAGRWKKVFVEELGLNTPEKAQVVLGDNRKSLVYLNTGVKEVPIKELEDCCQYIGLPLQVLNIELDNLLNLMRQAAREALSAL